jgi:hypothetical protein
VRRRECRLDDEGHGRATETANDELRKLARASIIGLMALVEVRAVPLTRVGRTRSFEVRRCGVDGKCAPIGPAAVAVALFGVRLIAE